MIKPPNWCSSAVPGRNGWTDPDSGEVYASGRFTQAEIDEFYGVMMEVAVADDAADEQARINEQQHGKIEAAAIAFEAEEDLDGMTKAELELFGREHGVELDRRKSKSALLKTMRSILSK